MYVSSTEWTQPVKAHLWPWHLEVLPACVPQGHGQARLLATAQLVLSEAVHILATCQVLSPALGLEQEAPPPSSEPNWEDANWFHPRLHRA